MTPFLKTRGWLVALLLLTTYTTFGQSIRRLDGSRLPADSLRNRVRHLMRVANVSGVAIAVFNKNRPVFSETFGLANVPKQAPLTPESVLYAASFAKAVFAYVVMQLVQEHVVDLDKPLVSYLSKPLPDYEFANKRRGFSALRSDERYRQITARMCLSHTTGFPNWRWFEPDNTLKIKFPPGSRYSYSGEGLFLLQFVIEQITGKPYETLAQERVFRPLGLAQTSYVWQTRFDTAVAYGHNAAGEPYRLSRRTEANAAGSMSTTLADFTRFFAALMQGKGLTKQSFAEMTRPQVRIRSRRQFGPLAWVDSTDNDAIRLSYGLGVGLLQSPYGPALFKEGHDEGWGHYCIAFPDRQTGIVLMTNNDNGESLFKELLAYAIGDTFTPWAWENYVPYTALGNP